MPRRIGGNDIEQERAAPEEGEMNLMRFIAGFER